MANILWTHGGRFESSEARTIMNRLKIGIRLESLGTSLRQAITEAQRLGVRGVQADATGDLAPETLSQTGRSAFRALLRSHDLELTALGCASRRSLDSPEDQEQRIEHTKAVLDLSVDLGARIALAKAGLIPEDFDHPGALTEALQALGHYGDRIGAVLALETGMQSGAVLQGFLNRLSFDTGSVKVNLDPASLLLHGFDHCASARALAGKIVHVRATDARHDSSGRSNHEAPLGCGDIDWASFLGVLNEIDYQGWLSIERNSGDSRVADVAAGIRFLGQFVGRAA